MGAFWDCHSDCIQTKRRSLLDCLALPCGDKGGPIELSIGTNFNFLIKQATWFTCPMSDVGQADTVCLPCVHMDIALMQFPKEFTTFFFIYKQMLYFTLKLQEIFLPLLHNG